MSIRNFYFFFLLSFTFVNCSVPEEVTSDNTDISHSSSSSPSVSIGMKRAAGDLEPLTEQLSQVIRRSVHFAPEVVAEQSYSFENDHEAEVAYWEALKSNRLDLVRRMLSHGVRLLNSDFTFEQVNLVLKLNDRIASVIISHLFKFQPQVFMREFENGKNVFEGAIQPSINFILQNFRNANVAHINIFKESLRNPEIFLHDNFFRFIHPKRAREMIEIVDNCSVLSSGVTEKVYLLPESLLCYDVEGETIFTKAIQENDMDRVILLMQRTDCVEFMLATNNSGEDAIDLASKVELSEVDPDYEMLCELSSAISRAYHDKKPIIMLQFLIERFIKALGEIPNNEAFTTALLEELDTCEETARRENHEGSHENVISLFIESASIVLANRIH